ncbi:MAG: hypothetical protein AB7V01_15230 [Vicinamibacterales bacterium]
MTAAELASAYERDAIEADRLFQGRTVLVSGTVASFTNDPTDGPHVMIDTGQDGSIQVQALLANRDRRGADLGLTRGQFVRLRCRVRGRLGDVQLDNCEVDRRTE